MLNKERILETFTQATPEIPAPVACLLSVFKYYGLDIPPKTVEEWCDTGEGEITLMGMKQAAIRAGFDSEICIRNMEQLTARVLTPTILFFENELGEVGYVVCYGKEGPRFYVGEPTFIIMQYFPKELEMMWIKGICLELWADLKDPRFSIF